MVEEFSGYIPLISLFIIILYFLYSFPLKVILSTTNSEINNGSNKSISIIVLIVYLTIFSTTYYSKKLFDLKRILIIHHIDILNAFAYLSLLVIFFIIKYFMEKKLEIIMLKEKKYKQDKGIYNFCLYLSISIVIIFSFIQALNTNIEFSNKSTLNFDFYVNLLMMFFNVCILFLTSGYIFSYGVLNVLKKFNFTLSNDTEIKNAYLIGANKDFYIIKVDNKKAISIKKDTLEKMEFL